MTTNNVVNVTLAGQTGTGAFVGSVSPTITTPKIALINDASGNSVLALGSNASAVNFITLSNEPAATAPRIAASGPAADIGMDYYTKALGAHIFNSTSNQPFSIFSGTSYQHQSLFNFANTAQTRNITFQDSDGTLAYLSDISGGSIITSSVSLTSADILALATVPITIVAAPGSNKYIAPIMITSNLFFNTTPYSIDTTANFYYGTSSGAPLVILFNAQNFLTQPQNAIELSIGSVSGPTDFDSTLLLNQPIILEAPGATIADGDSPITIKVQYLVIDFN